MILITDIGFINKVNADQSQDIFVQSMSRQSPLGYANVTILGKNGLPVFETRTDSNGHAKLPNLNDFTREKRPIAVLVSQGDDLSYLPVNQYNQRVQTSRFDTGGIYWDANSENNLKAFIFSDRGIYRPGETVKLGLIVKQHNLQAAPQFPVELKIENSRGQTVYSKKHTLPKDGFFEASLETNRSSATGNYYASLNLLEDEDYAQHLGSITFQVEEFQPDRLKLKSKLTAGLLTQRDDALLNTGTVKGWLKPEDVAFDIQLDNLYGTPAQNRKVTSGFNLSGQTFHFSEYENYRFSDFFIGNSAHSINESLPTTHTDEKGQATISLDLQGYTKGTYQVNFDVEGYEESGGRSVRARNQVIVSARDELFGLKIENDLDYIKRNTKQSVHIICVDKTLESIKCENVKLRKTQKRYISTLVEQRNGTYQYQSFVKDDVLSNEAISVTAGGIELVLDTDQPGKFEYELIANDEDIRQAFNFQVVGSANLSAELEKDNQLEITLDKSEYEIGDWVELQLNAPYVGSGLISIETERVHHFAWFKADNRQSTQRIQVPKGLQGNAYINVAFVRSMDSKEVFTAPLSYAIAASLYLRLMKGFYKLQIIRRPIR